MTRAPDPAPAVPGTQAAAGPRTLPHAPAADRNKVPILAALQRCLGPAGRALEAAAGTGQHAVHFAAALPGWHWQPTEADPALLPAIAARTAGLANVAAPVQLDVAALPWTTVQGPFDLVYAANLLHISPPECSHGLLHGASAVLAPAGLLVLYGPYRIAGEPLAESNRLFDESLRARDPRWGLRLLEDIVAEAAQAGLRLEAREAMPANNQLLVFRRGDAGPA